MFTHLGSQNGLPEITFSVFFFENDDFAKIALQTWAKSGVTPHVTQSPDDYTGAAFIFIEESTGDNAIIISPGAAAKISAEDLISKTDLITSADVFVTQLEQPMDAAFKGLEIAKLAGVTTVLNPAPAAKLMVLFASALTVTDEFKSKA